MKFRLHHLLKRMNFMRNKLIFMFSSSLILMKTILSRYDKLQRIRIVIIGFKLLKRNIIRLKAEIYSLSSIEKTYFIAIKYSLLN